MYSFPNLEPVCCSMSSSNCCFFGQFLTWEAHLLVSYHFTCSYSPWFLTSKTYCWIWYVLFYVLCLVVQSCLTLFNPMDCGLPGSFVHGDSPGKNTGVGCHALLQGIFPTQGSNAGLPHCGKILYCLSHQESPWILEWVAYPFSRGSSLARNRTGISWIAVRFFTSWATREAYDMYKGSKIDTKGLSSPPPHPDSYFVSILFAGWTAAA